jgi:hypothetical protein
MTDIVERLRAEAFDAVNWDGETMKQWDKIRKQAETLPGSDLPRLMFQGLIESLAELMVESACEIERLRNVAQSAWQPIDRFNPEADNPNVLVSDQGSVSEAYYDGEADAWFKAGKSEHDFDFVSSDRLYPSHWMPLPDPPALSSAERGA